MTLTKAVRAFAWLGILAFLFTVVTFIINGFLEWQSIVALYVNVLALIFLLFGLLAVYLSQADQLGKFGFISIVILAISSIWNVGFISVYSISFPVIHDLNPSIDLTNTATADLPQLFMQASVTSSVLGAIGAVLFGLCLLLYGKITRWSGVFVVILGLSSVLGYFIENDLFGLIGFLGFPIVTLWMCIRVLQKYKVRSRSI